MFIDVIPFDSEFVVLKVSAGPIITEYLCTKLEAISFIYRNMDGILGII